MFILGLTGPTGVGKSFAAEVFAAEGFAVVDADAAARAVVAPGSPCLGSLAEAFGVDILRPDGSLNRALLASRAFADPTSTRRLNAVTHPVIVQKIEEDLRCMRRRGENSVLLDAPALYESGADRFCNRVLAVVADSPALILMRIMRRDGLTEAEARRRISAQPEPSFYTKRADFILVNRGDSEAFVKEVRALIAQLRETGALSGLPVNRSPAIRGKPPE